jgi:hypothetical protein
MRRQKKRVCIDSIMHRDAQKTEVCDTRAHARRLMMMSFNDLLCSANDDFLLARVCTCAHDAPQEARSQETARAGSAGGGTGAGPA